MQQDDSAESAEGAQSVASGPESGGSGGAVEEFDAFATYDGKRALVQIHLDDDLEMTFACPLTANTIYAGLAELIYNLQQLAEQKVHDAKAARGEVEASTGPAHYTRSGQPFVVLGELEEEAYNSLANAEPRIETSIDQKCSWCGGEWDDEHMRDWMCPTAQGRMTRKVGPVSTD